MDTSYPNASITRRFAAIIYDSFLVLSLWMASTAVVINMFNDGKILSGPLFQLFLYLEIFIFYFTFWKIRGQTLGMQVWKIKTVSNEGEILSSSQSAIRFLAASLSFALLGLGFIWMLFSKDRTTWHDKISGSHVIYLGSHPYKSEVP